MHTLFIRGKSIAVLKRLVSGTDKASRALDQIVNLRYNSSSLCVRETGGNWVPGGEDRRTVSGPGGSSTKAFPSGAQDHLVAIGFMDTLLLR